MVNYHVMNYHTLIQLSSIGCIELVSIDLVIDFIELVTHFIELVEMKWLCMGEMVISSFVLFEITRGSFPILIIIFHEQR